MFGDTSALLSDGLVSFSINGMNGTTWTSAMKVKFIIKLADYAIFFIMLET
jgi:hypothetical protein